MSTLPGVEVATEGVVGRPPLLALVGVGDTPTVAVVFAPGVAVGSIWLPMVDVAVGPGWWVGVGRS